MLSNRSIQYYKYIEKLQMLIWIITSTNLFLAFIIYAYFIFKYGFDVNYAYLILSTIIFYGEDICLSQIITIIKIMEKNEND